MAGYITAYLVNFSDRIILCFLKGFYLFMVEGQGTIPYMCIGMSLKYSLIELYLVPLNHI
ncbi:hypothetical protein ATY89_08595 [Sulfolobus acidocaldarius]|uniref:Uncharacterized protein n=1 Tax=Sulfolobus acidocaldarius TaxID=2285 RepID=A0A0U2Y513_9CREN|nr:hypothetical protein ATY89_08595 [Sulfolobus acidocaldarius]ALU30673.1 hypothetical protein ATZ20_00005 [Sulfolobus acidocaldarius]